VTQRHLRFGTAKSRIQVQGVQCGFRDLAEYFGYDPGKDDKDYRSCQVGQESEKFGDHRIDGAEEALQGQSVQDGGKEE